MDHLKDKYLEEANDLLQELERLLLLLEENLDSKEHVATVFRIMHTLKGNSSMFGFTQIVEITHLLENCFDKVRDGSTKLNPDLLVLSLKALDHIKALLYGKETEQYQENQKVLVKKIQQINEGGAVDPSSADVKHVEGYKSYFIYFKPQPEILKNGSNPLYVLDDLANLGEAKSFVNAKALEGNKSFNPESSYLAWGIILATEKKLSEIQEIFLFIEHLCDLKIEEIAVGNIFDLLDESIINSFSESFSRKFERENIAPFVAELQNTLKESIATVENSDATDHKTTNVSSIRVTSDKLDDLMNLISELVASQARLSTLSKINLDPELLSVADEMEKITKRLRDKTFDICLIPIGNSTTRFKRLVRDLSKELNKKIQFVVEGAETELDKNVIEHLTDCLIHIFRNSIDHGIEDEKQRIKSGKNPEGKISLKAYTSAANVVIEVQDDGAGIDPEKVRLKAQQKGLIEEGQILAEKEVFDLLFHPGFSTAHKVTEVSGRGVGMDVVKKKIKELRGDVNILSQAGKGTTIRISIPLTISIIDGLMVRVAETDFVLPLSSVDRSYSVSPSDIQNSINNQLILKGTPVIYCDLSEVFIGKPLSNHGFAVLINNGNYKVAIVVEEIVGEYQAVLKPLGQYYKHIEFLSGASLKGDGSVALVLDTQKLTENFIKNNLTL